MHTQIVWFEVVGSDSASLQRFYGDVLGWRFQQAPGEESYGLVQVPEGAPGGGVGEAPEGGWTTVYVAVPDLNAAVQRAIDAGGRLLAPRKDTPGVSFAVVADPEGHPMGLAQPRAA